METHKFKAVIKIHAAIKEKFWYDIKIAETEHIGHIEKALIKSRK